MAALDIPIAGGQTGDEAHGDPNVNYLKANRGVMSWLWTVDHKRIGLLYLSTVALAFLVGGLFALVMRLELFTAGKTIVDPETYHRFFTLHGVVMVFLFLIPAIPAVLGNFLLPLMVGARGLAFPRLNMLSFYIYVTGAVFCVAAIIMESADTGWTFYTPYSMATKGCVLALMLSVMVLGLSSILTGINFIVTIHKMRAPGLTWARLPLFGWGMYATAITQILATPVLVITLGLLIFERVLGLGLFDPKLGGDPVLFQHFFWFYAHPAVYITVVSGMAVVSEIIATFSRRAVFGQLAIATSSLALALLGVSRLGKPHVSCRYE
jgi:cytochrome c oxidase subunit 1